MSRERCSTAPWAEAIAYATAIPEGYKATWESCPSPHHVTPNGTRYCPFARAVKKWAKRHNAIMEATHRVWRDYEGKKNNAVTVRHFQTPTEADARATATDAT